MLELIWEILRKSKVDHERKDLGYHSTSAKLKIKPKKMNKLKDFVMIPESS